MTRRLWIPATALFLAVALSITGSIPRDAAAAVLPWLVSSPAGSWLAAPAAGAAGGGEAPGDPEPDASWRTRALILLLILVVIVILVWRYLAGWKPTASGGSLPHPFVT